ncbi:MAG TPA: ATP-dependent DNA helicase [Candidatus Acidoferrales bacterium]|nr:ATP-dependent DNA helicase [Candidatus Acidoferrales bacterium]
MGDDCIIQHYYTPIIMNAIPGDILSFYADGTITELYPPQVDAIERGLLDGKNMVIATPTASGKTLLAEFAMLKSIFRGGKCLYIVPLKALASEKFDDFSKFSQLGVKVGISTGDYDVKDERLGYNDIIIATSEKADSLLRNRVGWMEELTVVVADEVHLLDSADRGPTLEVTLTKLRAINPRAQVLALSATVTNADEMAGWLNAEMILSDWRPISLHEGVYLPETGTIEFVHKNNGSVELVKKEVQAGKVDPPIALALDTLREGGQCLIFVNTRRGAEGLAKKIAVAVKSKHNQTLDNLAAQIQDETSMAEKLSYCVKYGVAFHHAGLSSGQRKTIEANFRASVITVIVCTPTLAAGLNLPARRVIIKDYKRYDANYGMLNIPVLEYKQMAGRAGRPGLDPYGEAVLIAKSLWEHEGLIENYILNNTEDVVSKLGTESALRTHVLSTIASGFARTRQRLEEFFDATFFGYQRRNEHTYLGYILDRVLAFLENEGMIVEVEDRVTATSLGHLVSKLYIDPLSAAKIIKGLRIAESVTPVSLLHLICSTPDVKRLYMRNKDYPIVNQFLNRHFDEFIGGVPDRFRDIDYDWFLSEVKTAMIVYDWIEEVSEKAITDKYDIGPGDVRNLLDTIEWVGHALSEISSHLQLHDRRQPRELVERVQNGVKQELLDLVHLRNIGRVRGRWLYDGEFTSRKALKEGSFEDVAALVGPTIAADIFEQLGVTIEAEQRTVDEKSQPLINDV